MNDLLHSLDHGNVSVLTLLDLSAAFGTIDHTILFQCLEHGFGIHDTAVHWFSSYLTNRTQTETVNNCSSAPESISSRVPQGSVVGPVLFILHTAPLSDVKGSHFVLHHSFADDTCGCSTPTKVAHLALRTLAGTSGSGGAWRMHRR